MERRTVVQVVVELLRESKQPMTIAEITQAMLSQNLHDFNGKDPKLLVQGAIERRCEGLDRPDTIIPTYFVKLPDGKYRLKREC